jgi:hypothetical protein
LGINMDELVRYVKERALLYWNETADDTEKIDVFPSSIVDFVIEYALSCCRFPDYFNEEKQTKALSKCKNALAMACVDVYAKAGAEGEESHSENGVSRTYSDTWIDEGLLDKLPNYVKVIS